jgi:hypothetical protein
MPFGTLIWHKINNMPKGMKLFNEKLLCEASSSIKILMVEYY